MNKYRVRLPDGETEIITAKRMTQDGSGLFFFDDDGELVASYSDGTHRGAMKIIPETTDKE